MPILRDSGPPAADRYTALVDAAPEATFYHTRTWGQIVTAAFPALEDRSGVRTLAGVACAVPLFAWRRLGGWLTTLHSTFPFLYGGPLPSRPATWAALLAELSDRRASLLLQGNPFAAADDAPRSTSAHTTMTTHLLRLPASIETYWADVLTPRKRNDIRRLTRKGVTVETSRAPADVEAVYAFYQQRMAHWTQRPGLVYPQRLYHEMLTRGGEAVRLYIARQAGRPIGGAFVLRFRGRVHYHAGYFDDAARAWRPNVLIQERVVRDAIADGYQIYDMLPSAGLARVEAFKESFGGVRTEFPVWERLGRAHQWIRRLRRLRRGPQGG